MPNLSPELQDVVRMIEARLVGARVAHHGAWTAGRRDEAQFHAGEMNALSEVLQAVGHAEYIGAHERAEKGEG